MFLHGGWLHVLGNMWFLWIFGKASKTAGPRPLLFFYLVCGLAAALTHVAVNPYVHRPDGGRQRSHRGRHGRLPGQVSARPHLTLVLIIIFITTVDFPAAFLLLYWFADPVFQRSRLHRLFAGFPGRRGLVRAHRRILAGIVLIMLMPTQAACYYAWS